MERVVVRPLRKFASMRGLGGFEGRRGGFTWARQYRQLLEVAGELQEMAVQAKLHLLNNTRQMQTIHRATSCASCRSSGSPGDRFARICPRSFSRWTRSSWRSPKDSTART